VWKYNVPFPYILIPQIEAPLLEEQKERARKRGRWLAKETPENPETKIIELKELVPLYQGSAKMVQPEE